MTASESGAPVRCCAATRDKGDKGDKGDKEVGHDYPIWTRVTSIPFQTYTQSLEPIVEVI